MSAEYLHRYEKDPPLLSKSLSGIAHIVMRIIFNCKYSLKHSTQIILHQKKNKMNNAKGIRKAK